MSSQQPTLNQLEMRGNFIDRHIGPNQQQIDQMLATLDCRDLQELIERAV